jgi:hypothetical protein
VTGSGATGSGDTGSGTASGDGTGSRGISPSSMTRKLVRRKRTMVQSPRN